MDPAWPSSARGEFAQEGAAGDGVRLEVAGGEIAVGECPTDVLEDLFRKAPLGLAVIGLDHTVRCHNSAWHRLTGIAVGPLPSHSESDLASTLRELVAASARDRTSRRSGVAVPNERFLDLSCIPVGRESQRATPLQGPAKDTAGGTKPDEPRFVVIASDGTDRVETGAALRSARQTLEERVEDRTRELTTLLEVTRNVSSTLELGPLLGQILDQLRSVVAYDGAWIYRLEGDRLHLLAYRAPVPAEQLAGIDYVVDDEVIDREVVTSRRPLIVDDVRGGGEEAEAFRRAVGDRLDTVYGYIRSWMSVPLIARGIAIGKLALDSSRVGFYSQRQAELALAFANQVAVAIENAGLYEHTNRRAAQLAAVQQVSAAIAGTLDLPSLLHLISRAIQTAAGYECALVSLVEGDPPVLRRVASVGLDADLFEEIATQTTPLSSFHSIARAGYRLGGAYFFPASEAAKWSSYFPSYQVMSSAPDWRPGDWHPQNLLIEPLVDSGGRLVGIISVDKPYDGRAPTAESVEILDLLAHQATIAIVNARLYERAKESAIAAERSRLARDLHDAVTQTLFSASLIAEVLPRLYERDVAEGRRRVEELRQLTRGALAEMRTLLLELRPAALTDAPIGSLIRQLAEATTGRARIPVSVVSGDEPRLPPEVKVALYRVAQEALNNVAKHSDASRAVVTVLVDSECVDLSIVDDGRGFDVGAARPDSLGMGIMRERVEAIGATLAIESKPGKGTSVRVRWSAT